MPQPKRSREKRSRRSKNANESREPVTTGQEPMGPVIVDKELQKPVGADEEPPEPFPPKNLKRCPFYFGLYGCAFGDDCRFQHYVENPDKEDIDAEKSLICLAAPRRWELKKHRQTPFPLSPGSDKDEEVVVVVDVKGSFINKATTLWIFHILESNSVTARIEDHPSNATLKSVKIFGELNKACQACIRICEFVRRDSPFFSLLRETTPKSDTGMEVELGGCKKKQRWPGQSVFRMLLSIEVDIDAFTKEFKGNNLASLKMIKRENRIIALVYAEEQPTDLSPAVLGVRWVFDYVVNVSNATNPGAIFSAKLLVERDQTCKFFETQAEVIQEECNCAFTVHEADGVGLARDFVLEVTGRVADLRAAFTRTVCYFQRFRLHESLIPTMEVLMDGSLVDYSKMINSLIEKRLDQMSMGALHTSDKVIVEYVVELYYVSIALVGESCTKLQSIRNDTGAVIALEELEENPGRIMVRVSKLDEGVSNAEERVELFLNEAVTRANEMLIISRAYY